MKLKTVELTKEQQKAIEWLDDAAGISCDDTEYVYATRIFNLLHQLDDNAEIASEDCKRYKRLYEDTAAQLEALKKASVTDKYPVCTVSGKALIYTANSEDYDELIHDIGYCGAARVCELISKQLSEICSLHPEVKNPMVKISDMRNWLEDIVEKVKEEIEDV